MATKSGLDLLSGVLLGSDERPDPASCVFVCDDHLKLEETAVGKVGVFKEGDGCRLDL